MGISRWFAKRTGTDDSAPAAPGPTAPTEGPRAARGERAGEPVKMAGTTTSGAAAAAAAFGSRLMSGGGLLEVPGQLVPEPENPADPNAVAVFVDGARVGYLPGYVASQIGLLPDEVLDCQVQMWAADDRGKTRVIGWVAYGAGPVAWPHTLQNPPAVTIADQRAERAHATSAMVDDALAGDDPHRAQQFERGMVGRYHYLETIEPIQQLKREGRLQEALDLCYGAISAAEADRDGREPAPWYTEQAAIIHRKRGEKDLEVVVLQRWLEVCPPERREGSKIAARLAKLDR